MTNPFLPTTYGLAANAGLLGTPGAAVATSSTTQTIGTGNLTFAIQAQCVFGPGMWVSITNPANSAQWMWGTVVSYDGLSQLIVNVTNTNGGGTISSWQVALAGAPNTGGSAGPTGPTGSTGAAAGPVTGTSGGLKIVNNSGTPSTKIDITALTAVMVNSSGTSLVAASASVTIDLTTGTSTAAANGMDGEARGTSAWLYLYLINNGTTTSGLATKTSPLSGAPTFPSGYSYAVYLGAMFVDGSGNLLRTRQLGNEVQYVITSGSNTAALPNMGNGTVGSVTVPTWVAIAVAAFVPPTASKIKLVANADVGGTPAVVIAAPNNAYGSSTSTNPPPLATSSASTSALGELVLESTNVYWASSGTDGYLFCAGWKDYVVAA